jgi:hypothetical protein
VVLSTAFFRKLPRYYYLSTDDEMEIGVKKKADVESGAMQHAANYFSLDRERDLVSSRFVRRILFSQRERFEFKIELIKRLLADDDVGGERVAEGGKGKVMRVLLEWTISTVPQIAERIRNNAKKQKKKKSDADDDDDEKNGDVLGQRSFGVLERTNAFTDEDLRFHWEVLERAGRSVRRARDDLDGNNNDIDDDDMMSNVVPFNAANSNKLMNAFTETMDIFANERSGIEKTLRNCSEMLWIVLPASKYSPQLSVCLKSAILAFDKFPEMRVSSLRACARQLRRSRAEEKNVSKEFLDVIIGDVGDRNSSNNSNNSSRNNNNKNNNNDEEEEELRRLIESTLRATVARESVLRFYPDAFVHHQQNTSTFTKKRKNRDHKEEEGEEEKKGAGSSNQKIPQFVLHFAKRIMDPLDANAIKFAPWFFHEICASKENSAKNNKSFTKKQQEKALKDMREVFSKLFETAAKASTSGKIDATREMIQLLRALKTKDGVYDAFDDSNPPKQAIEAFLQASFDVGSSSKNKMNYAGVLDAILSIDFRLLEKRAEKCLARCETGESNFLLHLLASFATRRKLPDFIECVKSVITREDGCSNELFRSEEFLKSLETHSGAMLEGQRGELLDACESALGQMNSDFPSGRKLLVTLGLVIRSAHKGIADSFTLERCSKIGQQIILAESNKKNKKGAHSTAAIYGAISHSPIIGTAFRDNLALFENFLGCLKMENNDDDVEKDLLYSCAMKALSNAELPSNQAEKLIGCMVTAALEICHSQTMIWIPRASEKQVKMFFASLIERKKFDAIVEDTPSATLWIQSLREWLLDLSKKKNSDPEQVIVAVMDALQNQVSVAHSKTSKDVNEEEKLFFEAVKSLVLSAEEIVSKNGKNIKSPTCLKCILQISAIVDAKMSEPVQWPNRKSTRDVLGKIGDTLPKNLWLQHLEAYSNASFFTIDNEEETKAWQFQKVNKTPDFKTTMFCAIACKETFDVIRTKTTSISDEMDEDALKKFEAREEIFETVLVKFEENLERHSTSVCFGYALAGFGHSLAVRARAISSLSFASTKLLISSESVAMHLKRALKFIEGEIKGDLSTNTKALTYLCGCISLLASTGVAFATDAYTSVFTVLLKNFEHFSKKGEIDKDDVMILNEIHRERTRCLQLLFESSSKEARRFAVQFATDKLHKEDSLARNMLPIDDENVNLSRGNRMKSTFWMLETFSSCSKFAWRKTFDDEKNESLVDALLHACETHLNNSSTNPSSRYLNRRRSLAILRDLVTKSDYECNLSARVIGRIAHVSTRVFTFNKPIHTLDIDDIDFDSFVLCCDIVTGMLYHRKEQLKRSTNVITAAIAHLVDVLRQLSTNNRIRGEIFVRCAKSLSRSLEACKSSGLKQYYCAHILAEVIASITAAAADNRNENSDNNNDDDDDGDEDGENNEDENFSIVRESLKPGIFALFEACSDLEFSYIFAMYGDKGIGGARRVAFTTLREEQKAARNF